MELRDIEYAEEYRSGEANALSAFSCHRSKLRAVMTVQ